MPTISTERIRNIIADSPDACIPHLLNLCTALEGSPSDYGFEFVTDSEHFGNEGSREDYYLFDFPSDRLPEGFTGRVYISAPDDGHPEDSEIVRYIGIILGTDGEEIANSDEDEEYFETVAECVAWLNQQLGGEIITRVQS
jgi:hypothetical protein